MNFSIGRPLSCSLFIVNKMAANSNSKNFLFYFKTQGKNWGLPRVLIFDNCPFELKYLAAAATGHRFRIKITEQGAGKRKLWSMACSEGNEPQLENVMLTVLEKMTIYRPWCPMFRFEWVSTRIRVCINTSL